MEIIVLEIGMEYDAQGEGKKRLIISQKLEKGSPNLFRKLFASIWLC